jgi:deoxyribodipyrimidine photo-lyase
VGGVSPPPQKSLSRALVWLRRDLRADDNAALYHALTSAKQVWVGFVFDRAILDALPRADRRVEFIRDSLVGLEAQLRNIAAPENVALLVRHGSSAEELPRLAHLLGVQAVYCNHDDDPYALSRDAAVRGTLAAAGIALHTSKDHVIFERSEVLTQTGSVYGIFTPYKNAWLKKLDGFFVKAYPVERHAAALAAPPQGVAAGVPTLAELGFETTNLATLKIPPGPAGAQSMFADYLQRIDDYEQTRNFPAVKGPSYLSTHLRFGTISVRQLAREAWRRVQGGSAGAQVWLSELIWRDFYHQVLHHHPRVVGHSFKREYDAIKWEHGKQADALFAAWCEGRTGYPLVDAAMHQINQTGYMHNRLRMVVASFLTKDLGIDWRRGEAYFALHLNDFDLAANNGGWQWASSSGCDAQPYFRIFNPVNQSEKFDAQGKFIRRYLPQLAKLPDKLIHAPWLAKPADLGAAGIELGKHYPQPVVDHATAREKTLQRYAVVKTIK